MASVKRSSAASNGGLLEPLLAMSAGIALEPEIEHVVRCHACQGPVQHPNRMDRLAARQIADLVAAGGAVGDDDVLRRRPRAPPAAGRPRPSRATPPASRPGSRTRRPCRSRRRRSAAPRAPAPSQRRERGGEGAERFLVAMPVHMRGGRQRLAAPGRASPAPGTRSAAWRGPASASRSGAGQQRAELVAQRQQAGRLQADHRQVAAPARPCVRRASARAWSTMPAARKVRPQHSGRPLRGGHRRRDSRRRASTRTAARRFSGSK